MYVVCVSYVDGNCLNFATQRGSYFKGPMLYVGYITESAVL